MPYQLAPPSGKKKALPGITWKALVGFVFPNKKAWKKSHHGQRSYAQGCARNAPINLALLSFVRAYGYVLMKRDSVKQGAPPYP